MDLLAQSSGCGPVGQPPCASRVAPTLVGDEQRLGVRVQRLADQLVRDARSVGVAGVDVGDPEGDRLAQDGQGAVAIGGRAHDPRAGELHRSVAEPGDG